MNPRGSAPNILEIHLLGPFRVVVDGRDVEEHRWQRYKPKLLVKLLALQPYHQLHREQAMELLWPEQKPESASNNLHKAIHMARRALEPGLHSAAGSHFILTQGQQIVLQAPEKLWVDVEEFEQAAGEALRSEDLKACEAALVLYGCDLLAEDLYEDWVASRREQLRAQYRNVLARLAGLYKARGEYPRSIDLFNQLLACDSTNEEAHRQLMHLYAFTGKKHLALRQYQHCHETLRKELDAEPDRATNELRQQILSGRLAPLSSSGDVKRGPDAGETISSLAILPLVNASSDPNAEYFSDGITESIINNLSQLPQLKVMARSTVFRYKGVEIDPQEVGAKLGVRAVLTGRVLQREDRLNVQTELVDVRDGSQLWGEQYQRRCSDIFELQDEIAREITGRLRLRLSSEEQGRLTKRYTENAEAYRLYLRGRYHWNKRTVEGLEKGLECFRQAINLDSGYALAYAGVSDYWAFLGDVGLAAIPSHEAFSRAKEAALQALRIDGALPEAYNSLAHANMHCFEWADAERAFNRAITLSPNHATAHQWYAFYLLLKGRGAEALTEAVRALELDPLSLSANGDVGQILYYLRRYDQAIEQYKKTLELEPNHIRVYLWLGSAYEQKEMYEEAITSFLKAGPHVEECTEVLAALAHAYAVSGRGDRARDLLAQLSGASAHRYVSPYNMALVHFGLGEKAEALAWLERAYEQRAEWMIYLGVDPRLNSLHADSGFKDLLRRIGFAP